MTRSVEILEQLQGRFGTQNPANLQIQRYTYYDYVRYNNAGATSIRFFSIPLGGTDPTSTTSKTLEQTNVKRSGEFEYPFIISQIKTDIMILPAGAVGSTFTRQPAAITNLVDLNTSQQGYGAPNGVYTALYNLAGTGVLNISFGQKQYFDIEQPFKFCPRGFGLTIDQISANGPGAFPGLTLRTGQSQDPRDVYIVTPPVLVERNQTIEATIDFPNGVSPAIPALAGQNTNVDIGLILDGFAILPSQ